ncbi:hypothetical protein [Acetobacter sp. DsW_063]|uniref:hypothetical protein n=1 Tax=Acetobacter sp. DsW_063 TaxID=1514894 RepID=UPI000A398BF6|nr:hypothetical protein [Acetobacter sp. DsW_063]OUJ16509.1 hypothetical protein HK28_12615 [Acetobacter sp. DsW_063]
MSKITAIVRADRMYLASLFSSNEEARYYLSGVYVHPHAGGVNVCATDGHTMGLFREPDGIADEALIVKMPKDCVAAIKNNQYDSENLWLVITDIGTPVRRRAYLMRHVKNDNENIREILSAELREVLSMTEVWSGVAEVIDGTFPAYLSVIPDAPEKCTGVPSFNPRYVKRISDVASFGRSKSFGNPVTLVAADSASPVLFEISHREDFVGVLMPMRAETRLAVPAWARRKEKQNSKLDEVEQRTDELEVA